MNIIEMRERIMFLIDHVQSPRFPDTSYINALNIAINDFVSDRYDNIKRVKGYSFEAVQRVRDELYTLVNESTWIAVTANLLPYTNSNFTTYRHMLLMKVKLNSATKEYVSIPTTYDEYKTEISRDPYSVPSNEDLYNQYYIERNINIQFYPGDNNSVTSAQMTYLANPLAVSFGTYVTTGNFTPTASQINCICAEDYTVVTLAGVPITGSPFRIGQAVTLTVALHVVTGTLIHSYTNCNLPVQAHEEICKMASSTLSGVVENYNKSQYIEQKANIS